MLAYELQDKETDERSCVHRCYSNLGAVLAETPGDLSCDYRNCMCELHHQRGLQWSARHVVRWHHLPPDGVGRVDVGALGKQTAIELSEVYRRILRSPPLAGNEEPTNFLCHLHNPSVTLLQASLLANRASKIQPDTAPLPLCMLILSFPHKSYTRRCEPPFLDRSQLARIPGLDLAVPSLQTRDKIQIADGAFFQ